jgi:hypothetical protein
MTTPTTTTIETPLRIPFFFTGLREEDKAVSHKQKSKAVHD